MYRRYSPKQLAELIKKLQEDKVKKLEIELTKNSVTTCITKEKDDLPSNTENRAENAPSDGIYTNSSAQTGKHTDH